MRLGLGGDVDHVRLALGVEVRQRGGGVGGHLEVHEGAEWKPGTKARRQATNRQCRAGMIAMRAGL
jgi:hypothetical protein